jgi:hypothetical protein
MAKSFIRVFVASLVLVAFLIESLDIKTLKASPEEGRIYISPAVIDNPSLGPGSKFIVNASAENIIDLYTWQIQIEFKPTILNCTRAWIPAGSKFNFPVTSPVIIDNTRGIVTLGASLINPPGVNGSDVLARIEFRVVGRGFSKIEYSKPYGENTFLLNSKLRDIPVTVEDGSFNNWVPPPPAKLYINPPRISDPTLTVGSAFNVSLSIINATSLHSWKTKILYNNSILNANVIFEGGFLKSAGSTSFTFNIKNNYNETHGMVEMDCSLVTEIGVDGNGELAIINFEVVGLGKSNIVIFEADLRDPSNIALPYMVSHGYFNNMLIAILEIKPNEVSGPEYTPGSTFKINVTMEAVESLKTCIFNLTYTPSVIQEINIYIPPVLGQIPSKKLQIDDEAGYIWTKLTYPVQITTYEPVTLMQIEFQVVSLGISPINLTDTQLLDVTGKSIMHEVHHGIFIGLIRDVAVVEVIPDLRVAYKGWIVQINVTVRNEGNLTETFDIKVYYNDRLGGVGAVTDLPPNQEVTIVINWNTTHVTPCTNYTILAVVDPLPYEFDTADNTLTDGTVKIRWMGDINGDGIVDMRDISDACAAFGSYPSRPNWNFYADLNRDGRVDLRDIGICCNNYRKGC